MKLTKKYAVILRGLPGSGKSTFARRLCDRLLDGISEAARYRGICSTDWFFYQNDVYQFNSSRLAESHQRNLQRFIRLAGEGWPLLICDNTNTQGWEWCCYAAAAKLAGYRVKVLTIGDPHDEAHLAVCAERNKHAVPIEQIMAMAARFER